jgi:hypothetical protein
VYHGATPGSVSCTQERGWINSKEFCKWMCHFISMVKPTPEEELLIVLVGHSSHAEGLLEIETAIENGNVLQSAFTECFPSESHSMRHVKANMGFAMVSSLEGYT